MANKFEKKEWVDRQSQYPSRRKLTATTIENVYEVERAEGEVTEPGNAFDALNMNDLEARIYAALGSLDGSDIAILDRNNLFTKTNLEDVLVELFTYASNGKILIANAIGGDAAASNTFSVLAQKILSGKSQIASAVGTTKSGILTGSEAFADIAKFISANKCSFSADGRAYIAGEEFPANNELWEKRISFDFGFTPNRIATSGPSINFESGAGFTANFGININNNPPDLESGRYGIGVKDLSENGFTIWYKSGSSSGSMSIDSGYINFTAYRVP